MGHEIAHAVAKHSIERASRALVLNVGTAALDIFFWRGYFKYTKNNWSRCGWNVKNFWN